MLLQEVDDREQRDPNNVNEVPVVGHNDGTRCFEVAKLLSQHCTTDDQQECNQATGDVNAVEAGGHVEGRSVGVRVQCYALVNEGYVFISLDRDEDCAKDEGENEPNNKKRIVKTNLLKNNYLTLIYRNPCSYPRKVFTEENEIFSISRIATLKNKVFYGTNFSILKLKPRIADSHVARIASCFTV